MQINNRLTSGLAWAGLLVVVAVPFADFITARFAPATALAVDAAPKAEAVTPAATDVAAAPDPQTRPAAKLPAAKPETVASVAPTTRAPEPVVKEVAVKQVEVVEIKPGSGEAPATETAAIDPTDRFLATGKKMPSYISDGSAKPEEPETAAVKSDIVTPEPPAQTVAAKPPTGPSRVIPATGVLDTPTATVPQTTASITSPEPMEPAAEGFGVDWVEQGVSVAPVPMPASMRPRPRPQQPSQVVEDRPEEPVVIEATTRPVPPAPIAKEVVVEEAVVEEFDEDSISADDIVTAEELEDWESGPLSDFLAKRQQRRAPPPNTLFEDGIFFAD